MVRTRYADGFPIAQLERKTDLNVQFRNEFWEAWVARLPDPITRLRKA